MQTNNSFIKIIRKPKQKPANYDKAKTNKPVHNQSKREWQ